jgi:DNA-binding XRE family transcriptional regulator
MDYAKKLKEYREHELLTQQELAKKLGVAFVSVNRWERGHHEPTMKIKRKIRILFEKAGIKEE